MTRRDPEPRALSWGRRYLMCPPRHYDVLYRINPWMHGEVPVNFDRAWEQWEGLVANLEMLGATVELLPSVPGLPDMVFTANAGVVNGNHFIPSRFRHPERAGETPHDTKWFENGGYQIDPLPTGTVHEGAGDALPFDGVLLSGYRTRSDVRAHVRLAEITGLPVRPIELVDPRFYHLDLTFCPLDTRRAIVNPAGWDRYGVKVIEALVPEPVELEVDEALAFCANSVVVDRAVVMPACSPRLGRRLEALGFEVVVSPVDEFLKAGGGCRCLTLALDVDLSRV